MEEGIDLATATAFYKTIVVTAYQAVAQFAYTNETSLRVAAMIAGVSALLWQARLHIKLRKKFLRIARGKPMTRKDRQRQQKAIQADAIFHALDRLVDEGKSLPQEVAKTFRAIHNFLDMPQLVPAKDIDLRGMTQEEADLLESILRSKAQLRRLLLARKKPRIPGPPPEEDPWRRIATKVVPLTRPQLGDGARRRQAQS